MTIEDDVKLNHYIRKCEQQIDEIEYLNDSLNLKQKQAERLYKMWKTQGDAIVNVINLLIESCVNQDVILEVIRLTDSFPEDYNL